MVSVLLWIAVAVFGLMSIILGAISNDPGNSPGEARSLVLLALTFMALAVLCGRYA